MTGGALFEERGDFMHDCIQRLGRVITIAVCAVVIMAGARGDIIDQDVGSYAIGFSAVEADSVSDPNGDGQMWYSVFDEDGLIENVMVATTASCMSPPPHQSIMTYRLRFQTAGAYRLYYRARNSGTPGGMGSDSMWRPSDFNTTPTLYAAIAHTGDYAWVNNGATYMVGADDVGEVLEFRIGSREMQARVCSFVLSMETNLTTYALEALCTNTIEQEPGSASVAFHATDTSLISDPDGDGVGLTEILDPDALSGKALKSPTVSCMSPPPHESIAIYRIRFQTAGDYKIYYRACNNGTPGDAATDSFWFPSDFNTTPTLYAGTGTTGEYVWVSRPALYTVAAGDVGKVMQFRVGARDSRARLGSLVFSTNTSLASDDLDALCGGVIEQAAGSDTVAFNATQVGAILDPDDDGYVWGTEYDEDGLVKQVLVALGEGNRTPPPFESVAVYRIRFQEAGTYRLFYRTRNNGTAGGTGSDSMFRSSELNTSPTATAGISSTGEYTWVSSGYYTVDAEDVGEVQELQIGIREANAHACSFVLSTRTSMYTYELDDLCSNLAVENRSPYNVTTTTAILRGELLATRGEDSEVRVYWGTSDGAMDAGAWQHEERLGGMELGEFEQTIVSLVGGSTIYYRAYTSNTLTSAWAPETNSFVVPATISAPTISDLPPLTIFDTAARMAGDVMWIGGQLPDVTVYYGLTDGGTSAGAWDGSRELGRQSEGTCSAIVDGLATDTLHFYRFYAENAGGGSWATSSTVFRTDEAYVHPRLLFTREELASVRNRRFDTHVQEWVRLVQAAESAANSSKPVEEPVTNPLDMRGYEYDIESMALVQMIDPDQPYWGDFENYFWTVIRWPEWYDGGGGIRAGFRADLEVDHILRALAMSYDWLYERFTWEEREEIRTRLIDYMDIHFNWYGALANDYVAPTALVQNHPFNAYGSLASVAYGVDGVPEDTLAEWDQRLRDRLSSTTMILTNWMGDGGNNEGPPYHTYGLIQIELWFEIMRSAGGFTNAELFEASPWFRNTTMFNLYSIIPGGADNYGGVTPIGDGPPYFYYSPLYIEALLAKRLGNPVSQWLTTQLEAIVNTGSYRLYRYLWLDPSLPSRNPSTLPNWHWFITHGYFMWRSSWENDATHFFLRSGQNYSHHCQPDCGQFTIHRDGVPYVVDLGYSTPKYTDEHNVLMVDGAGQYGEGDVWCNFVSPYGIWPQNEEIWGEMLHVLAEGEEYKSAGKYFDVLANPAPMYPSEKLTQWHRETLGIGNLYLVRDTVATNATADLDLLVHAYVSTPNGDSWEFWQHADENPWTTLSANQWSIDPRDATPQPPNLIVTDVSADSWTPTVEDTLFSPHNDDLVYVETRLGSRLRRSRTSTSGTSLLSFGFSDETSHWTIAPWTNALCEGLHATLTTGSAKVVDVLWPLNGTGCTSSDGWDVTGKMAGRHYGEGSDDLNTGYFGREVTLMRDDGVDLVSATYPVSILAHMEHGPSASHPLCATIYTDTATSLTLYTPHHPSAVRMEGSPVNFSYASNALTLTVPACEATSLPLHIEIDDVQGAPSFAQSPFDVLAATEDVAYSGSLVGRASDPDGDPLVYTKVSGPDWLTVSSGGALSGTPDAPSVGGALELRIGVKEAGACIDSLVLSTSSDLSDATLDGECSTAVSQDAREDAVAFRAIDVYEISDPDSDGLVWAVKNDEDSPVGRALVAPTGASLSVPPHESVATYRLRFAQAGTYRLYYSARNNGTPGDGGSDTFWRPSGFDTSPDVYAGVPTTGAYAWVNSAADYTVSAEDVGQVVEFQIGVRERDARICSIVLSMRTDLTTDTLEGFFDTVIEQEEDSDHLAFGAVQTAAISDPDDDGLVWSVAYCSGSLTGRIMAAPTQECKTPPPHESELIYRLRFAEAGSYHLYYRASNNGTPGSGGSDSFWRASDFNTTPTLSCGTGTTGLFTWTAPAVVYTVEAGDVGEVLELRFGSRERFARVCSFVLSTQSGLSSTALDALFETQSEQWQSADTFAVDASRPDSITDPDGDGSVWAFAGDSTALDGLALEAPAGGATSVPPQESVATYLLHFQQPGAYRLYYRARNNGTPSDTGSDTFWRPSELGIDPTVEASVGTTGSYDWTGPVGTYTVGADDIACTTFTVRVTDPGGLFAEAVMRISVLNSNDAPVFCEDPRTEAAAIVDTPYSVSLAGWASDPDEEDSVTYSLTSGPAWLSVASDGTASGTPGSSDVGLNQFSICATDESGVQATAELDIVVQGIFFVRPGGTGNGSTWALADDIEGARSAPSSAAIWVAEGTYSPSGSIGVRPNQTWMGGFPATGTPAAADRDPDAHLTIIDGSGLLNPIFYLSGDDNVRIDGFAIQNGFRAVRVDNSHNAILANCWIRSNKQATYGLGVFHSGYSSLTIDSCWFTNNYGQYPIGYGAAIFLGSGRSESEPLELNVVDTKFCGNRAEATYHARSAAVLQSAGNYAKARMERCVFAGNHTNYNGAVLGDRYGGNEYTFVNCVFSGNVADRAGGVNYASGARPDTIFQNCTFAYNTAQEEGGALCLQSDNERVVGSIFASNSGADGRAINLSGGGYLAHNLYYNNTVSASWGGENSLPEIYVSPGVNPQFETGYSGTWSAGPAIADAAASHTVFTDSAASWNPGELVGAIINPNTAQALHSMVVANTATSLTLIGCGYGAGPSSAYCIYDYHLSEGSPAIDASDDGSVSGLLAPDDDMDSASRPTDGDGDGTALPDIGAYEAEAVSAGAHAMSLPKPVPAPTPKPTESPVPEATPTPEPEATIPPGSTVDPVVPPTVVPPEPAQLADVQACRIDSDGHYYAVVCDLDSGEAMGTKVAAGDGEVTISPAVPVGFVVYLYDMTDGGWTEALFASGDGPE